jgi:hypothetical protein
MSLATLIRPPLVWFAAAEAALIATLGLLTWHVWVERTAPAATSSGRQAAAGPPAITSAPTAGQPPPPGQLGQATPSTPSPQFGVGPTPGIRTDADFLSRQLSELNRVEASFEDLEWRVTRAIADAIERYLESVVLPSIDRSERGR